MEFAGFFTFIFFMIVVSIILTIAYFSSNIEKTKILDISESIILKHRHNLYIQKIKSTKTDPYGNKNLDNWYNKEIPNFCENVLKAHLPKYRRFKKIFTI